MTSMSRPLCRLCAFSSLAASSQRSALARSAYGSVVIGRRSQSTSAAAHADPSSSDASLSSPSPSTAAASSSSTPIINAAPPDSSSSSSLPKKAPSTTRIVASILLSRPPRQASPLTPFEKEYYRYARRIDRALSSKFNPEWYFRKGSQGEQAWREMTEAAEKGKELDDADVPIDTSLDGDLHNLERKKDRTLYLLAKKDRKEHAWQFPQGGVEGSESLVNAALRELREEFGADLDVWQTGKVPAAHHAYRLPEPTPKGQQDTAVFFMPARVMRGTPQPNKQESLVDYAWCTKEEIQEKISADLYTSVAKVLSE